MERWCVINKGINSKKTLEVSRVDGANSGPANYNSTREGEENAIHCQKVELVAQIEKLNVVLQPNGNMVEEEQNHRKSQNGGEKEHGKGLHSSGNTRVLLSNQFEILEHEEEVLNLVPETQFVGTKTGRRNIPPLIPRLPGPYSNLAMGNTV